MVLCFSYSAFANDEIVERLADKWLILDLDLATILGTNKPISDNVISITESDEEAGGL